MIAGGLFRFQVEDIMASLPKPVSCQCGNFQPQKLKDPERWICASCGSTLVERPSRKLAKGVCRRCGKTPKEVRFKKGKNICVPCGSKENAEWKTANVDRIQKWRADPEVRKRLKANVRKAVQRSPEAFIRSLLHGITKQSNYLKRIGRSNRLYKRRGLLPVTITYDDLWTLWQRQAGRCALTRIPMVHEFGNPRSISVDRIDSAFGYIPDNIQLVCKWVNHAKQHNSNEVMLGVFAELVGVHGGEWWRQPTVLVKP
jgi:hypothetical protein